MPVPVIPLDNLTSLVAIEAGRPTEDRDDDPTEFETIGTAFVLGVDDGMRTKDGNVLWHTFLVTADHVVSDMDTRPRHELYAKCNTTAGPIMRVPLPALHRWTRDPVNDIAVFPINFNRFIDRGADLTYFKEDRVVYRADIDARAIGAGSEVFVYGFPMKLSGKRIQRPIVRGGVIARLDDDLFDDVGGFLVDCHIYPGTSGGPVFLRPSLLYGQTGLLLIGVVFEWEPWPLTAENTGLARVAPMDAVKRLTDQLPADASDPV